MYLWRSYVVFNEDIQNGWTDGELAGLVCQAYLDMITDLESLGLSNAAQSKQKPTVMTAIALGGTVSFASSLKARGRSFLYKTNTPGNKNGQKFYNVNYDTTLSARAQMCSAVDRALKACQIQNPKDNTNLGHKNGANCGEEMAAYQICMVHGDPQFVEAKVVAVNTKDKNALPSIVPPCDTLDANFGCKEFTGPKGLGLYVVPDTTVIVARDPVEGALSCTQPTLCAPLEEDE